MEKNPMSKALWRMNQWKKTKIREQTKNEKILLSLLGIIIVIWISFRFIIIQQQEKIKVLKESKLRYQEKIDEINITLKREADINKEFENLHNEKEGIISKYFPKLDQAQIIYLLNDLIDQDDVSIVDVNFSRPEHEDLGGFQVRNMNISLPYKGEYMGIIEMVNSIGKSPRKILVNNLSMDRKEDGSLNGNISLKVYSLEGIAESDEEVIYVDRTTGGVKGTPFSEYDDYDFAIDEDKNLDEELVYNQLSDYKETTNEIQQDSSSTVEKVEANSYIRQVLLDFENKNNYFLPSQSLVKGNVIQSENAKSGKYSLRFEYNILAIEEENKAYIDISKNNINLKYPPKNIGLWIYSYDYSPATIGIGFKGQMGDEEFIPLTEGIGWTGWRYLEIIPPEDLKIYPLKVENIYIDMPKNREDFGVILVDKLEAIYDKNLGENGFNNSVSEYIFHIVSKGDTISGISIAYYGTDNREYEILKLNEMKPGEIPSIGKVLVLKKP